MNIPSERVCREVLARLDVDRLPELPPNYPPLAAWKPMHDTAKVIRGWRRSLSRFPDNKPVLYVHIPFCRTICGFCGFYRTKLKDQPQIKEFLRCLGKEMDFFAPLLGDSDLRYVCIGGGTPSLLSVDDMAVLFRRIRDAFNISQSPPIAFEASPETLDAGKLDFLKRSGVDWLSIGVQSFDEELTRSLNRFQDRGHTLEVIRQAQSAGIGQVEVDLMVGLPGQTEETFLEDVRTVAGLDVERVYIFELQSSPMVSLGKGTAKAPATEESGRARAWRRKALDILIRAGYRMRCGHWVYKRRGGEWPYSYDQGEDGSYSILGLGPSAVSYAMGEVRYQNAPSVAAYERLLDAGRLPLGRGRFLIEKDEMVNFVLLDSLHRGQIDAQEFSRRFGVGIESVFGGKLKVLRRKGILVAQGGNYVVANRAAAVYEVRRLFFDPKMFIGLAQTYGFADDLARAPEASPPEAPPFNRLGDMHECNVGYECNARCAFCYNPPGAEKSGLRPFPDIAAELLRARRAGFRKVVFSGGEPCLHVELGKSLALARRLGFEERILHTNGLLTSDPGLVDELKKRGLDRALVSVHGPSAQVHDGMIGLPGGFDRALSSLENFKRCGIDVGLVFVVQKRNHRMIPEYLSFFRKRGVRHFVFPFVRLLGKLRAEPTAREDVSVPWKEALPSLLQAISLADELQVKVEILNVPPCVLQPHEKHVGDMYPEGSSLPGDAREPESARTSYPKLAVCLDCRFLIRCLGPCEDYIEHMGHEGINPILR